MPRWFDRLFRSATPAPVVPTVPPAPAGADGVATVPSPVRELTLGLTRLYVDPGATATYAGTPATGPVSAPKSAPPVAGATVAGPKAPGGYRLLRNLGEGSFGTVFLAEDEAIPGLKVAIKFFAHGPGEQWKSLQDEVRRLVTLDGVSGIVQIRDVAADATPPYFVMSYAEGGSLAGRLDKGALPVEEAVALMERVADALAVVHGKGVIHCDLKPGNILLDGAGNPLLADFGLAQFASEASPAVGTFFYMAPEQADVRGGLPDTRWDVHALGAVLYALVTGRPPRIESTMAAHLGAAHDVLEQFRLYRELSAKLPPPADHYLVEGMDGDLGRIIDRCLAADPAERYRDAAGFRNALRDRRAAQRRRPLLWVAGVTTTALVGLSVFGAYEATAIALTRTGAILAHQDRGDNVVTARLLADLLRAELHQRIDRLQDFANEPRVRELTAGAAAKIPADAAQSPFVPGDAAAPRAELDRIFAAGGAELFPDGLGLVAAGHGHGFLLAGIAPGDPTGDRLRGLAGDLLMRDVADKEWFAGRPDPGPGPHPPTPAPYLSGPFRNVLLGGSDPAVAFSAPVFSPKDGAPVGVLVGMIRLAQTGTILSDRLGANDPDRSADSVVLANDRGQCVIHPRLEAAGLAPLTDGAAPTGFASVLDAVRPRLDGQGSADLTDNGPDLMVWEPGDGPQHVAAATFVPTPDVPGLRPWTVFSVRDPEVTVRPVADLRKSLVAVEGARLLAFAAGCAAVWAGLLWALRRTAERG